MASLTFKPPMDIELQTALSKVSFPTITSINPSILKMMRTTTATPPTFLEEQKSRGISHKEVRVPTQDKSGHEIVLSILQRTSSACSSRPCLYWIHGGAFHWGDRLHTLEYPIDVILECNAILISVEYRLAPEHPYSTAVEDCYAGLQWTAAHMQELGIDPKRLMVGGMSAGGGLAASTTILCRDREGPAICAQVLICPALDDRLTTVSSHQYLEGSDFLPRSLFEDMWKSTLPGWSSDVVPAARIENLSGLPATYLDVGSAELLRDETVAFASRVWASGVQADLHIWSGGFHGFDIFLPDAAVSKSSRDAKLSWVKKIFRTEPSLMCEE